MVCQWQCCLCQVMASGGRPVCQELVWITSRNGLSVQFFTVPGPGNIWSACLVVNYLGHLDKDIWQCKCWLGQFQGVTYERKTVYQDVRQWNSSVKFLKRFLTSFYRIIDWFAKTVHHSITYTIHLPGDHSWIIIKDFTVRWVPDICPKEEKQWQDWL